MHIVVTGANGFVGQALCHHLGNIASYRTTAVTRRPCAAFPAGVTACVAPTPANIESLLAEADCVVHLAARVHQMKDTAADPLREFVRVNAEATLEWARTAARAGVRRFVYLSSIKVNGEETQPGHPFGASDAPDPRDPYGVSKRLAEDELRLLAEATGLEVVIIRPPLVYGPGVKGNFATMMRWIDRGVPLPLGAIDNRRSLVALPNLVGLISTCLSHPAAANQTFLVSDDRDLSTTMLLKALGLAMGKPPRLIRVPAPALVATAALLGKRAVVQRLCGTLQVDIGKTKALLGWTPSSSVEQALEATARHFRPSKISETY